MALLLETDLGDLVIDLDVEGSPSLAKNILKLAKARFYTQSLIHSVTPNRFCQLGCPVGDGTGGTCIYGLLDSSNNDGDYRKSTKRFLKSSGAGRYLTAAECQEKGRVVACLAGGGCVPDTIGSQFLITTAEGPDCALDGYSIPVSGGRDSSDEHPTGFLSLGVVAEDDSGVLEKINEAYTDSDGRPFADIRICRALVVEDPFEDPPGMGELLARRGVVLAANGDGNNPRVTDSPSPVRPAEEAVPARISVREVINEQDVEDEEVIRAREEEVQRKEDRSRAVVLEMLGDLPSADIKAPENVLFVCKLNPATQDEDLELIFSRFDPAVKVEIIRDHDTGSSLQYAFAEFSTKEQAEEAYFKMDNALVDDRRIKVDFSQSVSKIWDKYNQKQRMPRGDRGGTFPAEKRRRSNDRGHPREQMNGQRSERERDEFGRVARARVDQQGGNHYHDRVDSSDERVRDTQHRRHSNGRERQHRDDTRRHRGSPGAHHRHRDRSHRRRESPSPESRKHKRENKRSKRSRRDEEDDSYRERSHRSRDRSATRDEYDRHGKQDERHARRRRESSHDDDGSNVSTDGHRRRRDESEDSYRQRKRRKEHRQRDKDRRSRKHSRHYDRETRAERHIKDDRKRHHSR